VPPRAPLTNSNTTNNTDIITDTVPKVLTTYYYVSQGQAY